MINGESKLTTLVRDQLESCGAHCVKLSDRFTRGVPDMIVVTNRIVMVEFKIFVSNSTVERYKKLGLTGSQDHHMRQITRRTRDGACVITGEADGSHLALWLPLSPETETVDQYQKAFVSNECFQWMMGTCNKNRT